jgi:hypothetical protein
VEWAPIYHIKGWGKFNRNYGDFCTGADTVKGKFEKGPFFVLMKKVFCSGALPWKHLRMPKLQQKKNPSHNLASANTLSLVSVAEIA